MPFKTLLSLALMLLPAACAAAEFLPGKNLFRPFIADPTQPSYNVRLTGRVGAGKMAEINMGDGFGAVGWDLASGAQLRLGIMGGVAARFDIAKVTNDIQVADYSLLFPLDYKKGPWELRAMYWHTSSHLGDDYIKSNNMQPGDLDKHVTDDGRLLASYNVTPELRVYGGGGYAFNMIADSDGRHMLHGGWECVLPAGEKTGYFTAMDLQSWQRVGWRPSFTARTGVRAQGKQAASVYLEFFSGQLLYLGLMPRAETHWSLGLGFEL